MPENLATLAMTRREAADALRVSLRTIDYLLEQGKLRARRIGRRIVIPRAELEHLLRHDTPVVQGSASMLEVTKK